MVYTILCESEILNQGILFKPNIGYIIHTIKTFHIIQKNTKYSQWPVITALYYFLFSPSFLPEASLLFFKHAEHNNKSELQYLLLLLPIFFLIVHIISTFFFSFLCQCHHDKEPLFSLIFLYNFITT